MEELIYLANLEGNMDIFFKESLYQFFNSRKNYPRDSHGFTLLDHYIREFVREGESISREIERYKFLLRDEAQNKEDSSRLDLASILEEMQRGINKLNKSRENIIFFTKNAESINRLTSN